MNKYDIEYIIKEYSSEKLLAIIQQQANSYSEKFIDYAKDELIRRNVTFKYDEKDIEEVSKLSEEELRKVVETDHQNYHLEHLEIARAEYLKRGYRNEMGYNDYFEPPVVESKKKYPALNTMRILYQISGVSYILLILYTIIAIGDFHVKVPVVIMVDFIFAFASISCFAVADLLKVFIDIESNTRK